MISEDTTERPLLGRVFEAQAEAELASALEREAGGLLDPHRAPPIATYDSQPSDEPLLPFLGTVLEHIPGAAITIERRLDLAEDLYLPDHSFVHAADVKPASACMPVLPMTMSLEAMAEIAACLAPGYGLLGFENVQATRWIELADAEAISMRISARSESVDAEHGTVRIAAAIRVEGQSGPAISASVIFGDRYRASLAPDFHELSNAHHFFCDAERLYAERHMFHGPSFRTIVGEIIVGDDGVVGQLIVPSSEALFRSTRRPQLLTSPALLDAIGQLVAIWALEHERFAFPIGLGKLEIYGPTPPVGTRTPVRVHITRPDAKAVVANVEVQDGAGGVWMRIEGWRSWKFRWERRLADFRRLPERFLLSETLAASPGRPVVSVLDSKNFGNFDSGMLARCCLSMNEMDSFKSHEKYPQRQQQWLFGRVVAKDAVRRWIAEQTGEAKPPHPASFSIEHDAIGRPIVRELAGFVSPPNVSLAHCETHAVAVAHADPVGVDIERIAARESSFVEMFTSSKERQMLEGFPAEDRDVWVTRLWCAKEAVGKLLGAGLSAPRSIEAIAASDDGRLEIRDHKSSRTFSVGTTRHGDFIVAATQCGSIEDERTSTAR
jgi:phosphopantetheinyl transferase